MGLSNGSDQGLRTIELHPFDPDDDRRVELRAIATWTSSAHPLFHEIKTKRRRAGIFAEVNTDASDNVCGGKHRRLLDLIQGFICIDFFFHALLQFTMLQG